jgi:crotonobetainyl-CoA:carnitine CoA-transferase CaiB-like acyl-CoA transferase
MPMRTRRPLSRLRVLEAGNSLPVRFAGMLLADLGADVVRIEDGGQDPAISPAGQRALDRGKRSIGEDAAAPHLDSLARATDVAILDDVSQVDIPAAPHQVRCRIPTFPVGTQPMAFGNDPLLVDAYAGLLSSVRTWRGGPGFLEQPEGAFGAGILAAICACCGLLVRAKCGRGQEVEISALAGALAMQMFNMVARADEAFAFEWEVSDPRGWLPTFRFYKGSDGRWFCIACPNPIFWVKLCVALGREDLAADERFANSPYVPELSAREEQKQLLEEAFSSKPAAAWIEILEANDLVCGPVLTRDEWMDHPQNVANGMRVGVEDPVFGKTVQAGVSTLPVGLDTTVRPAPMPGQDAVHALLKEWSPRDITPAGEAPGSPLEGVRVIDLANYAAGAMTSKILADLGAEVIKVETRDGDPFRQLGLGFAAANRGKQSLAVELSMPQGREVLVRLIQESDVLVTNLRPGRLERLALTERDVHEVNDEMIYVAASGFGWSGPWPNKPCLDIAVQAVTGWSAAQGGRDTPTAPGPWPFDNFSPHVLCLATVAGLLARCDGARDYAVKTSMVSGAMTMQVDKFVFNGRQTEPAPLTPDSFGVDAGYRLYEAADGWVIVAAREEAQWRALLQFADCIDSQRQSESTAAAVERAVRERPVKQVLAELSRLRVSCAPVLSRRLAMDDPVIRDAGLVVTLEHPEWGRLIQTGKLARFSLTEETLGRPAPSIGENTRELLASLAYSEQEMDDLCAAGVTK